MRRLLTHGLACLCLVGIVGGAAALAAQDQKEQEKTEEEIHAERSREIFEAVHCPASSPEAMKAFEGCWKIGSIYARPIEDNLTLGMRASEREFKLLIDSYSATQAAYSSSPRYCLVGDRPTIEPYPQADFSKHYTYVYVILELPPERAGEIATGYHLFVEEEVNGEKIPLEQYQLAVIDFAMKGGKYIRTLINMGPTHVWWDSDAEEDFWALPVSCAGWEEVERRLKDPTVDKSPETWAP